MGRIHILPDAVANKIAAGEVVERPASVVKELVENALDAGATSIRIEVEAGGRRLIRVIDDGSGMMRDDALLAFERHATSKLRDVKDLLAITTLGFRGEALPSIAAVSRLTLETRAEEEPVGTLVEIAGGKLLRCEEAALARGTTVTVRDLFFNVPARRKFLRSDQTELAHIAALASHYSLAYPSKAFLLTHEQRVLLDVAPVSTLRERVFQVFGSQVLDELVELSRREVELPALEDAGGEQVRRYCLYGFISRPHFRRSHRDSIYLFVNRRVVRDKLLTQALLAAYRNVIPAGQFPFALLFLDCDPEEVDVNVHPAKIEVRFRRPSFVFDFVRDALRTALANERPGTSIRVDRVEVPQDISPQPAVELPFSEFSQQLQADVWTGAGSPGSDWAVQDQARLVVDTLQDTEARNELPVLTLQVSPAPVGRLDFGDSGVPVQGTARTAAVPPRVPLPVPASHGPLPVAEVEERPSLTRLAELRPLGQIRDSFIVAAGPDGLWIIDQHVAHERVLFERILRQMQAGGVEKQQLLLPLVIELTPAQLAEYERIVAELAASGFDTERFGLRAIAVQSAPAGVAAGDLEKLLYEILEVSQKELRSVSTEMLRQAMAASIACHAAIKVNTPLEFAQMEWLIQELARTEFPMSCPHGRPVLLRYSLREILKGFHRI